MSVNRRQAVEEAQLKNLSVETPLVNSPVGAIPPIWPLRLGCGAVNLYAGFFLLTDPARFYGYVPSWLSGVVSAVASVDVYLRFQGATEILIAIALLGWFVPCWCVRLASALLALEMLLILVCCGLSDVLFRNLGLLGAALSLFLGLRDARDDGAPPLVTLPLTRPSSVHRATHNPTSPLR